MKIDDTLDIGASIETVWNLTVDVERWPEIAPTMTSVKRLDDGPIAVGSEARIKQPGLRPAVWTVTSVEAPTRFVWETRLGTVRMIAGHHLQSTEHGTRNRLTLELTGFGSGLLSFAATRRLRRFITTENLGFKQAAES